MPRGDRTGPGRAGPLTGRAAGFCAGFKAPGYSNHTGGRNFGFSYGNNSGRGMGMAWGKMRNHGWQNSDIPSDTLAQPITESDEKQYLESRIAALKGEMKAIEKKLKEFVEEEAQ
ncbi:MAG: DUF5320 domain-containing protein [bacterium]|nr:DUF5320 domain-containing protein [bacterium]